MADNLRDKLDLSKRLVNPNKAKKWEEITGKPAPVQNGANSSWQRAFYPSASAVAPVESKEPSLLQRLGLTGKGAAQQYAGSSLNALSTMKDFGIFNNAWTEEQGLNETAEQIQKSAIERRLKTEQDAGATQRLTSSLSAITNKPSAEAILKAPDPIRDAGDSLIARGGESTASAKDGASWLGKLGIDVGTGAIQLAADIGIGALTGGGALLPMALRSFGGAAQEAEDSGASINQQVGYGGLSAGTSVLVERLFSAGKVLKGAFGKGVADDVLEKGLNNAVAKLVKNPKVAGYLPTALAGLGGEGIEEFAESMINPILQKITFDPNANYTVDTVTDALYDGLIGGIIGAVAGGLGGGNVQAAAQDVAQTPTAIAPAPQDIAPATPTIDSTPQKTQPAVDLSVPIASQVKLPTEAQNAPQGIVEPTAANVPLKEKQAKIITDSNPMTDGYHVGVRNSNDIKTFVETLGDSESFVYGDFSQNDAQNALSAGEVTVYSSKPIGEVGEFVSTSKNMAQDYAGNGQVFEKTIPLEHVAWINGDEGQYSGDVNVIEASEESVKPANTIFPATSLGAKITTPKSELPQGTGAMSNPFVPEQAASEQKIDKIDKLMPEKVQDTIEKDVIPERESMRRASQRLDVDVEGEKADLASKAAWSGEDLDTAMQIKSEMGVDALESGDFTEYQKWRKEVVGKRKSEAGRAMQAIQKWTREGKQSALELIDSVIEITEQASNTTPEQTNEILLGVAKHAVKAEAQYAGNDKAGLINTLTAVATERGYPPSKRLLKSINKLSVDDIYDSIWKSVQGLAFDELPRSFGSKLSTYQYISHLLNAKTLERNTIANAMFAPIEQFVNNFAIIPDAMASSVVAIANKSSVGKMRTVGWEKSYFSKESRTGAANAARDAYVDIALDINREGSGGKYKDSTNRTFKRRPGNLLNLFNKAEGALGYGLNWTDAIQKGATQGVQESANKKLVDKGGRVTPELAAKFTEDAVLTRSFQRQTLLGEIAETATKWMNVIGFGTDSGRTVGVGNVQFKVKDIGLGDLVQKYTRVMGALATSGAEYTPLGYAKAIYNIGVMTSANANSAKGRGDTTTSRTGKHKGLSYNESAALAQHDFAISLSRAMTGTGLAAAFGALAQAGVLLLGGGDDDYDKENMQSSVSKLRGLVLNISALGRMIEGEDTSVRDGDYLMDTDFVEPINSIMRYGVTVAESDDQSFGGRLEDAIGAVSGSILDMPFMQNMRSAFNTVKYRDKGDDENKGDDFWKVASDVLADVVGGAASGFIPGPIRHAAQAMDNKVRDTTRTDSSWEKAYNRIVSGVPKARESLPAKSDAFGKEYSYTDSDILNILNAMLLPGSVSQYNDDPVAKELLRIDTKYPERKAPKTIKDKKTGTDDKLTAGKRAEYQKKSGQKSYSIMQELFKSDEYKRLDDESKEKLTKQILGYAKDGAKRDYIGEGYKSSDYERAYEAEQQGINPSQYFMFRSALDTIRPEGGTPAQYQYSKAINAIDLSTEYKSKLWEIQKGGESDKNPFTGALAQKNMSPEDTIKIMEEYSKVEKEMEDYVNQGPGLGKSTVQAAYFLDWLSRQYTQAEVNKIYEVFDVWGGYRVEKPSVAAKQYVKDNPR